MDNVSHLNLYFNINMLQQFLLLILCLISLDRITQSHFTHPHGTTKCLESRLVCCNSSDPEVEGNVHNLYGFFLWIKCLIAPGSEIERGQHIFHYRATERGLMWPPFMTHCLFITNLFLAVHYFPSFTTNGE